MNGNLEPNSLPYHQDFHHRTEVSNIDRNVDRISNYQEAKRGTPGNTRKAESIKVCQQLLKIAENSMN
jgi:hypothetical protein